MGSVIVKFNSVFDFFYCQKKSDKLNQIRPKKAKWPVNPRARGSEKFLVGGIEEVKIRKFSFEKANSLRKMLKKCHSQSMQMQQLNFLLKKPILSKKWEKKLPPKSIRGGH